MNDHCFKCHKQISQKFDIEILANAISDNCICDTCGAKCFNLYENEIQRSGVVYILCRKCRTDKEFKTSSINNWI